MSPMLKSICTLIALQLVVLLSRVQAHEVVCNCEVRLEKRCGTDNETYASECAALCAGVWSCVASGDTCPDACLAKAPPTCPEGATSTDDCFRAKHDHAMLLAEGELLNIEEPSYSHVYMRSIQERPWDQTTNEQAFDAAFGSDEWSEMFYEQADAATLSLDEGNCIVMMEGGDSNANALNAFLAANMAAIENYIVDGGSVFINAAPNQGGNISLPFGATLHYYNYEPEVAACAGQAGHPIFEGLPTAYTGNWFAHAHIVDGGKPLICAGDRDGAAVLTASKHGLGTLFLGGMTTTNYASPTLAALQMRANMLTYLNKNCRNPNAGPDFITGPALPQYWLEQIAHAGLSPHRLGFNTTEGQWYCDRAPTCVGFGYWFDTACPEDALVCAGGDAYGYGVHQAAHLLEMLAMGDTRHFMCPTCPPSAALFDVCNNGVLESYDLPEHVPAGVDSPGAMSTIDPAQWVDCDCTLHHKGEPFIPGRYWWNQMVAAGVDAARVTFFGERLYYDAKPTCVAYGASGGACNSAAFVCAGGATYGYGSSQMAELAAAIANGPSHKHPLCPV